MGDRKSLFLDVSRVVCTRVGLGFMVHNGKCSRPGEFPPPSFPLLLLLEGFQSVWLKTRPECLQGRENSRKLITIYGADLEARKFVSLENFQIQSRSECRIIAFSIFQSLFFYKYLLQPIFLPVVFLFPPPPPSCVWFLLPSMILPPPTPRGNFTPVTFLSYFLSFIPTTSSYFLKLHNFSLTKAVSRINVASSIFLGQLPDNAVL